MCPHENEGDFRRLKKTIPFNILKVWGYIKQHLKRLQKFYHAEIFTYIRDMSHFSEPHKNKRSSTAAAITDATMPEMKQTTRS